MNDSDDRIEGVLRQARALYNEPRGTPREEMWQVIAAGLAGARSRDGTVLRDVPAHEGVGAVPGAGAGEGSSASTAVVDLAAERSRRSRRASRPLAWAVTAAAALVLGIGIGRMSAPAVDGTPTSAAVGGPDPVQPGGDLGFAAREHLGRTESLLTLVQADARDGHIDPAIGAWARGLLSQTRLLMDARGEADPAVHRLLEDLELVLVQIAGAGEAGRLDEAHASTELELALQSLGEGEVLSRLHAVVPIGLSGT